MTKIEMGKQYTYQGEPVRVLCVDLKGEYPVAAAREDYLGGERVGRFTAYGEPCYEGGPNYAGGLVEVKAERKMWVNVYDDVKTVHSTRELADACKYSGRVACVEVTYHDGDGL